jgi:meiotically up-regulated gene 157 (Mug157) protein
VVKNKYRLTIELVPSTSWYSNVRSNVSRKEWDIIRNKCYKLAFNKCEICEGVGHKHKVECHEIWNYDDDKKIQKLTGLIALCPKCHKVKHIGLSIIKNEYSIAVKQIMKVNKISENDAVKYIDSCFEIWKKRSEHDWKLDITYLDVYLKDSQDFPDFESLF